MKQLAIVLSVVTLTACGYALAGGSLPPTIKTVGIPPFLNKSSTGDIDRVLTESVRTEFQGHRRYSIVPDGVGVDAVLRGTITSVRLDPSSLTTSGQARTMAITITASLEFVTTSDNKVYWSNPNWLLREEYEVTTATAPNDPAAFLAANAPAYERLAKKFASSLVTQIFEVF